jgi:hypothetical protein
LGLDKKVLINGLLDLLIASFKESVDQLQELVQKLLVEVWVVAGDYAQDDDREAIRVQLTLKLLLLLFGLHFDHLSEHLQ